MADSAGKKQVIEVMRMHFFYYKHRRGTRNIGRDKDLIKSALLAD